MQRIFDIIFSSIAIVVLSPLMIPIIVVLRFSGEGEIFFLQDRIGLHKKTFKLYKFATMLKNSPNSGTVTTKNDQRILPIGRYLRKTKINELPQLINVFLGDMSLIGPRPLTKQAFGAYSSSTQNVICTVPPGLSGIGSIVFRHEEDILNTGENSMEFYNSHIVPYKGKIEEWYVNHRHLRTYFYAIFGTVATVFLPRSDIVWKLFKNLPAPSEALRGVLNYSSPE